MNALAHVVKQGKALYVGISSYSPVRTKKAYEPLQSEGIHLLIHQPSYSMLNRHIETGLLDTLSELGVGCIGFSALAQGLLTEKYISGKPVTGRVNEGGTFLKDFLSPENLKNVRGLDASTVLIEGETGTDDPVHGYEASIIACMVEGSPISERMLL